MESIESGISGIAADVGQLFALAIATWAAVIVWGAIIRVANTFLNRAEKIEL